ncbi:MAG TPA: hypothetical protein VMV79_04695 [Alphaproteobacteria bacterium]|nr:hypothetical protein [Alphaproteobacteria bacterium]
MATEFSKPMLDVGSPRVLNVNLLTRKLLEKDPGATPFFRSRPLNDLVLVKDTLPEEQRRGSDRAIGTKLYFPFNEANIYEGGRTIFVNDKNLEPALTQHFGDGAFTGESLAEDTRILKVLDRLPSLDPFLLKDVFLNEKIPMNEAYFEVSKDVWDEIETFILQRFEPLVKAAFPDASASGDKARRLIEKIWEARDLDALDPLIRAFRLPREGALEIFSAWKGINFYAFQYERAKPQFVALLTWLRDLKPPVAAVSTAERNEMKAMLEGDRNQLRSEWHKADGILKEYQDSYDKMFKLRVSSAEFVAFLGKSSKMYWELGNSLGKVGHASYCWDVMAKRLADKTPSWEALKEIVQLLDKIFSAGRQAATSVAWS